MVPLAAAISLAALFVAQPVVGEPVAGGGVAIQVEPQPDSWPGRVVLVGDSVMLGAQGQLESAFAGAGYDVVVDAAESRSTSAGATVLSRHLAAGGADAVVVMLGANDAADVDTYRERVRAVVGATALVPRIYWMTIPEVRGYYPAANRVVREELALRPGSDVLDWSAVSTTGPMASGDGLHLNAAGADAMGWFVSANVVEDLRADALAVIAESEEFEALGQPGTATPRPAPTGGAAEAPPTTAAPATTAAPSGSDVPEIGEIPETGDDPAEAVVEASEVVAGSSLSRIATGTMVAFVSMLVVLALLGVSLAIWALWRTRGSAVVEG